MNRNNCLIDWVPTRCDSEPRPVSKICLIVTRIGDAAYGFGRFVSRQAGRVRKATCRVHWATVGDAIFFPLFFLTMLAFYWVLA